MKLMQALIFLFALGTARSAGKPNVLFIMCDDLNDYICPSVFTRNFS